MKPDIKGRRKELGLTLEEVGNKVGVGKSTVRKWETGDIENMRRDKIKKLADALRVSPAFIMGWEQKEEKLLSSEYDYLPISVAAGLPEHVRGVSEDDIETITIPDAVMGKWANRSDIFMMRVNGESMNKIIPDQSLIAIKEVNLSELKDGDIVVYSNGHDYSVKHFYRDENEVIFRPDSTDKRFRDHVVSADSNDLKIHGKVVVYIVEMD